MDDQFTMEDAAESLVPDCQETDDQAIERLSLLPPIEYDRVREPEAKKLKVRVSTLDKLVHSLETADSDSGSGSEISFNEPELLDEVINGVQLIRELKGCINRYLVLPEGADDVIALWILHTYAHETARVTPILAITSPDMRCGKSTVVSVLRRLSYKPLLASNISPAAVFRTTEKYRPTLLIDEADTFLKDNDELRGIINSGHTRDTAYVVRTSGDDHDPRQFSTWAPKSIALIGSLPVTIADRSIEISMRRKTAKENVEKLPLDTDESTQTLREKIFTWSHQNRLNLTRYEPKTVAGLNDRAMDNWTHLFSIANIVSPDYLTQIIQVALSLSTKSDEDSAGTMLLSDLIDIFGEQKVMFSRNILEKLINLDDRPWGEWKRGNPMSVQSIYKILKPYKIVSSTVRIGHNTGKGIYRDSLQDAYDRYVSAITSVTPSHANNGAGSSHFQSVTPDSNVTAKKPLNPSVLAGCDGVTDSEGGTGEETPIAVQIWEPKGNKEIIRRTI